MKTSDFILNMLDRIQNAQMTAVDGLSHEELTWRPVTEANSIGFVLWHQTRVEDILVQGMIQRKPQVWISDKWAEKLNLSEKLQDTGYGYTAEQVSAFPVPQLDDLLGYAKATRARTIEYLKSVAEDELDKIIKTPVFGDIPIAQVFIILLGDTIQHTGQIAYLRGLQRGLNK
jgi:DinB superfamily